MSPLHFLKIASRVALFGIIALAPLPALAQGSPTLGGTLQLEAPQPEAGQGQSGQSGEENPLGGQRQSFDNNNPDMYKDGGRDRYEEDYFSCLSNSQIRRGLRRVGFEEIEFVRELRNDRVVVEALYERDGWVYSMRVDRCDGRVDRIRPLYYYDDFGFSLRFDF